MEQADRAAWFVLRCSTAQMRVAAALRAKGFEVFVPMCRRRRQWSDRVKVSTVPLFSSFVFCRFHPKDRVLALSTPGVSRERERGGIPIELSDAEIEHLHRVCELPYPAEECDSLPSAGEPVRIIDHPDIRGFLSERGHVCRVLVPCTRIGRAVLLHVPLGALEHDEGGS